MITSVSLVALGGAVGAALRYLAGLGVVHLLGRTAFPLGIITVNILGSFLMGVFAVLAMHRGLNHLSPLVMTGLFGGFTTFSAFSLETALLIERGSYGMAALYIGLSVGLSVLALFVGMWMTRSMVL